jgi:hypothetical protein
MKDAAQTNNALAPNDFLGVLGDLIKATQAKDTGVGKVRAVRSRFESMGGNMRALDLMLRLRKMEDDDAETLLVTALRYCRWASMKIGAQTDMFAFSDDAPRPSEQARGGLAEAEAYNEGNVAGRAGRSSTDHRFQSGSPLAQQFFLGWQDGQSTLAETWGIALDPTGLPIKPQKKEKAAKKGATPVNAAKPRGRGKRGAAGASA